MSALTERLRGMFDMGVPSEDTFNRLTPAGFRLLREVSDEIARLSEEAASWRRVAEQCKEEASENARTRDIWFNETNRLREQVEAARNLLAPISVDQREALRLKSEGRT